MAIAIFILVWLAIVGGVIVFILRYRTTDRARQRLFYTPPNPEDAPQIVVPSGEPTGLARWLYLAGFKDPKAAQTFIIINKRII